jgi:glycosyltransferase involved in cell wall biosynthesis
MRFLTQPLSGVQRYSEELVAALDDRLAEDSGYLDGTRVVGLVPDGIMRMPDWRAIEVRRSGRLTGHAWEQVELAYASRDGVLVSLAGSGPLSHERHVLAIHDANLFVNPHFYSRPYRIWHGLLRPRLMRRARALITVSAFSRGELARWCGLSESLFRIVPDSAEHILRIPSEPEVLARHALERGRYVLCVGNQSPNKNTALAIRAFAAAAPDRMRLAVAGGAPAALAPARAGEAPWLSMLGRVSDGELRALYENAAAFVFPSLYEGFGVPPLEAMALGCPVVSSDSSAMPEVLGDAALFFKSGDVAACAASIRDVLALDATARERIAEAGRAQAARFSWRASADHLGALLRELEAVV